MTRGRSILDLRLLRPLERAIDPVVVAWTDCCDQEFVRFDTINDPVLAGIGPPVLPSRALQESAVRRIGIGAQGLDLRKELPLVLRGESRKSLLSRRAYLIPSIAEALVKSLALLGA